MSENTAEDRGFAWALAGTGGLAPIAGWILVATEVRRPFDRRIFHAPWPLRHQAVAIGAALLLLELAGRSGSADAVA